MAQDESPIIEPEVVLTTVAGLEVARLDGSFLVLDQRSEQCHVLGGSAGLIWSLIDGHRTVADLIDDVGEEFSVDPADVADDVVDLVRSFLELGIVEPRGTVSSSDTPSPRVRDHGDDQRRRRWSPTLMRLVGARETGTVLGPYDFGDMTVRLATDVPEISAHLSSVLRAMRADPEAQHRGPHCDVVILDEPSDAGRRCRILIDGLTHRREFPTSVAIEYVMTELNLRAIASTGNAILLHAGAVERDGLVVVVAGVSGRGKSTLTAALVRAGFRYVTDEMVAIEPSSGWVRPYPKPLDLGTGSLELLGLRGQVDPAFVVDKVRVDPLMVGGLSGGGRVALVVVLDVEETIDGEDGAQVFTELSPLEALSAVLPNVFAETYAMPEALQCLADLCVDHPVLRLPRLPIGESVGIIEQFLESH